MSESDLSFMRNIFPILILEAAKYPTTVPQQAKQLKQQSPQASQD